MAAFATHEDLAVRLGLDLTSDEQTRADALLELATGIVQDAARQRIELVENDEITVRGFFGTTYLLPERPVHAVTAISRNGTTLSADRYRIDDGDTLTSLGGWGCTRDTYTITYTHGHDPIPAAIKAICLEAVVRVWVNPGAVMSERVGSEQTAYLQQGTPTGLLLTTSETQTVRRLTRRGARSEMLR